MSNSKSAAKSVAIIILLSFGSKLLGFIREILIASNFGSGIETDIFFVALTATGLFTTLITKAINTSMIPVLSEIENNEGVESKSIHTSNLLNILLIVSFLILILGIVFSPQLVNLLAFGFNTEEYELAVLLTRIGMPVIIFASILGVFSGYLQSELKFIDVAIAQFPYNLVYIVFLLIMTNYSGIIGLMITNIVAVGFQILFLIPSIIKTGYKYSFILNLKNKYVNKIIYLIIPILISAAVNDLNNIVDKSLASTLINGSISALNYAHRLNGLILGIFISAITTVLFPMFSKEASKKDYIGLNRVLSNGINTILLITLPSTVGIIIFSEPIVRIAFERGAFDNIATHMTSGALNFYSIGLTGMALKLIIDKVYYSIQDTMTPMIYSGIGVLINIILNFLLTDYLQHNGLALASSISATIIPFLLLLKLKAKIGNLSYLRIFICGIKSLIASIIMGVLAFVIFKYLNTILLEFIALFLSILCGVIFYVITISLFKIQEVEWIIKIIKSKFH